MNSVIITGATSMLGLALVNECIANNTRVMAIVREDSRKISLIPNSDLVTIVECCISKLAGLTIDSRNSFDAFYHFAWEATASCDRNVVDKQQPNIDATLNAVRLAKKLGCKKFIGVGSQAEYGRVEGIISPQTAVSPDSAYGVAKYAAGRFSSILAEQIGIDFIWTRVFSTYGINDAPSTMIMYCIERLLNGEKPLLTKCEQQWDYLNCHDAARAFYLIGENGQAPNIYNIGSGAPRPLLEYVCAIRNAIDPTLAIGVGEREYTTKQVMCLCPDISSLKKDTKFEPSISFSEGINEVIKWYKCNFVVGGGGQLTKIARRFPIYAIDYYPHLFFEFRNRGGRSA